MWHLSLIFLPLLGAVVNAALIGRASPRVTHFTGVLPVLASFVIAVVLFGEFLVQKDVQVVVAFDWLKAGGLSVPLAFMFDRLSMLMLMIVTGIGTVIHIFAGGYLHEEKSTARFFCYLNLFIFMMLLLIMSENLLVMFVGWEGVGLCSYLLIGYWFGVADNAKAGMKAFIVNRIGDVGFLLAIFLTWRTFDTVSFATLRELLATTDGAFAYREISLITLCLFIGACGKSAQFPLHVWLPDAMAGPTPVSALIHAATMVTAGIFMITRLNFMFVHAPDTMQLIAVIGALTALLGATIAITQNDIKKVLAYSTVSQLGFMILACGVGAFSSGIFHLLTHACFKALLFLGAGSVIVALHHKQDMREMGGLFSRMRITAVCFLVGVLAIIGFPGLAGFFSKDEILYMTYTQGSPVLWAMATVAAFCTAFYMVRLFCLVFLGKCRYRDGEVSETGAVMWLPLMVLAVLSVGAGYLGVPHVLGGTNILQHYLAPLFVSELPHHDVVLELTLMGVSVGLMAIAAVVAYLLYCDGYGLTARSLAKNFSFLHQVSLNKYWLDELGDMLIVNPCRNLALFVHRVIDLKTVDGIVNNLGQVALFVASATSYRMSGSVHRHAMVFFAGLACVVVLLLF